MYNTNLILFLQLAGIFVQAKTEPYEYYTNVVNQHLNDLPLEREGNLATEQRVDLLMQNNRPDKVRPTV